MTHKKTSGGNHDAVATASKWYICQSCGTCCRWPGFVRMDATAIRRASAFLGMAEQEFIANYTELLPSRAGLMLATREDHSCILFDGRGCVIHPVKPDRCRGFPNAWNFPGWRAQCRAAEVGG